MTKIKQSKVTEILMRYCYPRVEYDGVTAWEIAGKIMQAIEAEEKGEYNPDDPLDFGVFG